jgi:DNA-binding PadR family transcriptional regulator
MTHENQMTEPELLLLGLVAEMPRHGYQLAQVVEERNMREWTSIGFSSVYYLLNKLEKKTLVRSKAPSSEKSKKVYSITATGKKILVSRSLELLSTYKHAPASTLIAMLHWPFLSKDEAISALKARAIAVESEVDRFEEIRAKQQLLPDYIESLFDFTLGQLMAEQQWILKTSDYMQTKPWHEE